MAIDHTDLPSVVLVVKSSGGVGFLLADVHARHSMHTSGSVITQKTSFENIGNRAWNTAEASVKL